MAEQADERPRVIINLPMLIDIAARFLLACPPGATVARDPSGKSMLIYWADEQAEEAQPDV